MNNEILSFYKDFSQYSYPGLYMDHLKSLPDDIFSIAEILRNSLIHRVELNMDYTKNGINRSNSCDIPWWRQPEDDNFPTVSGMLSELFRRDKRGLTAKREKKDRLVLTCRFISLLFAAVLKSKKISARVRSGFSPYFGKIYGDKKVDHWIVQYFHSQEKRWVNADADALHTDLPFDPLDIPDRDFYFPADSWMDSRKGKIKTSNYYNAGGFSGSVVIAWELFYDFHCLMNNEVIYFHHPEIGMYKNFINLKDEELKGIDNFAVLMKNPDKNFRELRRIFESDPTFRLLKGGLL